MVSLKENKSFFIMLGLLGIGFLVSLWFFVEGFSVMRKSSKAHAIVKEELQRIRKKAPTKNRLNKLKSSDGEIKGRFAGIHRETLKWFDKVDTGMTKVAFKGYLEDEAARIAKLARKNKVWLAQNVEYLGLETILGSLPRETQVPRLQKMLSATRDVVELLLINKAATIEKISIESIGKYGFEDPTEMVDPRWARSSYNQGEPVRKKASDLYENMTFTVSFTGEYPVLANVLKQLIVPSEKPNDPLPTVKNFIVVKSLRIEPVEQLVIKDFESGRGAESFGYGSPYGSPYCSPMGSSWDQKRPSLYRRDLRMGTPRRRTSVRELRRTRFPDPPEEGTRFPKYNRIRVIMVLDVIDFTEKYLNLLKEPQKTKKRLSSKGGEAAQQDDKKLPMATEQ